MKRIATIALALAFIVMSTTSFAEDNKNDLQFYVAPALWASGVDATLQAGSITVSDEIDFNEIMENFEGGLMGGFGARKGKFSVNSNFMYIHLESELPAIIGALGSRSTELNQFMIHVLLGYDLIEIPIGDQMSLTYTQLLGPRYYKTRITIDRLAGGELRDMSPSWVDFVVGGAFNLDINEKWGINVYGDAGGFGWGDSSESSWHAGAFVDYHLSERSTIRTGYKALNFNKESSFSLGKIDLEIEYSGPVVSWMYTF